MRPGDGTNGDGEGRNDQGAQEEKLKSGEGRNREAALAPEERKGRQSSVCSARLAGAVVLGSLALIKWRGTTACQGVVMWIRMDKSPSPIQKHAWAAGHIGQGAGDGTEPSRDPTVESIPL